MSRKSIATITVALIVVIATATMGPAITFIDIGLVVALLLWYARDATATSGFDAILRPFVLLLFVQVAHFAEEYATGFQRRFPSLFGYAWTDERFVAFNLIWIVIFAAAAAGLARREPLALLPAWFLALIGGIGNGVLHLAMAAASGGYYPGAATAPLLLVGGVVLVRRLYGREARPERNGENNGYSHIAPRAPGER